MPQPRSPKEIGNLKYNKEEAASILLNHVASKN